MPDSQGPQLHRTALLVDHDANPLLMTSLSQLQFGLAGAEAEIAIGVLELNTQEISDQRVTTLETTRSQMRPV